MKIGIIVPSFYPATIYGGPIFSIKSFCEEIASENIKIDIMTTDMNGTNYLNVIKNKSIIFNENPNIRITYYKSCKKLNFISFGLLFNLFNKIKTFDIVKIEDTFSVFVPFALLISLILKKKIILSPRGVFAKNALFKNKLIKKLWIYFFISPFKKKINWHATSNNEKDDINNYFSTKLNIKVIANGIEKPEIDIKRNDIIKRILGNAYNKKSKYIIGLGRKHPIKRFDQLIDSFQFLSKDKFKLILVGSDDSGHEIFLKEKVKKNKQQSQVFFYENLEKKEKDQLLYESDLLVLPSLSENFGNVVPESLICGTPVIVSDKTPWHDLEENNVGLMINITPKNLSNSILKILSKPKNKYFNNCIEYGKKYLIKSTIFDFKKKYCNLTHE